MFNLPELCLQKISHFAQSMKNAYNMVCMKKMCHKILPMKARA